MENNQQRWVWGAIAVVLFLFVICTCCIVILAAGNFIIDKVDVPQPLITIEPQPWDDGDGPTQESTLEAQEPLTLTVSPLSTEATETLEALIGAEIPDADLHELGVRFLGVPADTPRVASTTNPDYEVGTVRRFFASDVDTDRQFEIEAVLEYKTEHVYMWVEDGKSFNRRRLEEAADLFEEHTYPTNREFFGSEWTPGIDGDPHVSILHAGGLGFTVAGYFSSPDEYVRAVREDSNEMEMFYINIDNVTIGSDFYNGVLAHEFQHMIHWNNDGNEDTWLNEGCSELAMELNERRYPGHYDVGGSDISYIYATDTQLNSWPEGVAGDASANYGGAYLFTSYFLDRFGEEATKALVAHPENGMESVDLVLEENLGVDLTHKDVFADWVLSNLLDEPVLDSGQYGYKEIDPYEPRIDASYSSGYPLSQRTMVHQYAVDYIQVESDEPLKFNFTGSTEVKLLDTDAHSGQYLWWSHRNDDSDTRLSRVVDLTNAEEASLSFWTWYHIEEDWDYAYVMVGTTDSGRIPSDLNTPEIEWQILDDNPLGCTTTDPNGNSFGCGFTGTSNGWEQLSADLSPYAGQEIVVRFEYITDAAVNQPGFTVDDVIITVDGTLLFEDDMEEEDESWIAEGFVRHANVLPQEWIVQLVMFFGSEIEVQRLLFTDPGEEIQTEGSWSLPFDEGLDKAIITISALAPVTTEEAPYEYTLRPIE